MKALWWTVLQIMRKTHVYIFLINVTLVTLTFDLVNTKSIVVLSLLRANRTLHMKALWFIVIAIISGNHFYVCSQVTLVTLTFNLSKINRGHVLTKTNQKVDYKSSVINNSQENELKTFFYKSDPCDLHLWPSNPTSIGVLSPQRQISIWNMKALW